MLQRIQTIYLTIVVILSTITFFLPVLSFTNGAEAYQLDYSGLSQLQGEEFVRINSAWALTIFMAIIPIIAIITIFLYKKRLVQIRLCVFNIILMLGFYVMLYINATFIKSQLGEGTELFLQYTNAFPLVCAILSYLALRAIGKDEALVYAADRLR